MCVCVFDLSFSTLENTFRRDEPDDLADELDQIQRAIEHCERRNQHEVHTLWIQRY